MPRESINLALDGLMPGLKGRNVQALQERLHQLGYLRIPQLRENYNTVRAVTRLPIGAYGSFDAAPRKRSRTFNVNMRCARPGYSTKSPWFC